MSDKSDAIRVLHKSGKTASGIFKILKPTVSRSGVHKVIKRFEMTGSYSPRVRSTPPRPVRTKKLVNAIRMKLRRNPQRSACGIAKAMNINHTTVQNVLEKNLKFYPYKKVKQQLLSGPTRKKRLKRARLLLHHLQDCTQPPVLWTDKKLFTVQAIHNAQNDKVWARNVKDIPEECRISFRRQKLASVMVWAGVMSCSLETPLIFIEEGVKINQHVYLGLLRDQVFPWVQSTIGDCGLTLQQDGVTSHSAKMVQSFCKEHFKGFWPNNLWPPSSPDLNPMDFGIWSILEQKVCTITHKSVDSLKRALVKSWDKICEETVHATCSQVSSRL